MANHKNRIPNSAADQMECNTMDCHASFRVIAQQLDTIGDGIDSIVGQVKDLDVRITAIGERVAVQETSTISLWHEVRDMGRRLNDVHNSTDEIVRVHAKDCPGREYARERLRSRVTSSTMPRPRDEQTHPRINLHVDKSSNGGGFTVPQWLLYLAIGGGILIAVAGYTFGKLANGGLSALPAAIEQVEKVTE